MYSVPGKFITESEDFVEGAENKCSKCNIQVIMGKSGWDDIPPINGISVDWEYEPDNPLGKRGIARMSDMQLRPLLNVDAIRVMIATQQFNTKGILADLSQNGVALYLGHNIGNGSVIKLGMILGSHKLISDGIVRNVTESKKGFRVGVEFDGMSEEDKLFISGLHSSISYHRY